MPICVSCALGESHSPCPLANPTLEDPTISTVEAAQKITQQRLADDLGVWALGKDGAFGKMVAFQSGDTVTGYEYHTSCIKCHNLIGVQRLAEHYCPTQETIHDYIERLVDSVCDSVPKLQLSESAKVMKDILIVTAADLSIDKDKTVTTGKCMTCLDWFCLPPSPTPEDILASAEAHIHTSRVCTKCGLLVFLGEHNCARDNQ